MTVVRLGVRLLNFKDDLAADLTTFVSASEFAQVIDVDGVLCRAQWLEHTADKSQRLTENFDGLHGDFSELYFMREPFIKKRGKLPHKGDLIYIQGKRYTVERCEDELGMVHVECSSYRQASPRRGDKR